GDADTLQRQLLDRQAVLQEEFMFVANANIGGEYMEDSDIARLEQIGARRWWRHFDNSVGLAGHEAERLAGVAVSLPVQEQLLADRPDHVVPWTERKPPVDIDNPDNRWGFDMRVPAHAGNYGELYNLRIR